MFDHRSSHYQHPCRYTTFSLMCTFPDQLSQTITLTGWPPVSGVSDRSATHFGAELGWWEREWCRWQQRRSSVNVGEGEHVLNWVRPSRAISVGQSWTIALLAKHFELLAESLTLQCFALSMHILLTGLRGGRAKANWSKKAQTGADCPLDICLVGVSIPSHSTCNFSHMVHNWYGLNN